jgi:hypothetical protein
MASGIVDAGARISARSAQPRAIAIQILAATLWLAGIAVRMMQSRALTRRAWCWLGVSLIACIASRHINAVLIF